MYFLNKNTISKNTLSCTSCKHVTCRELLSRPAGNKTGNARKVGDGRIEEEEGLAREKGHYVIYIYFIYIYLGADISLYMNVQSNPKHNC